jgi:uncharacterized repeat protein (TIGR01451 family)
VLTNEIITYVVAVTNHGPSQASAVTVTSTLPPGATFLSAFPARGGSGNTVIFDFGTLPMGVGTTGTIQVLAPNAASTLGFTATGSAGEQDLNPGNNTAAIQTAVLTTLPVPTEFRVRSHREGNTVVLTWNAQNNVVLQMKSTMSSGTWTTAPYSVTTTNGTSSVAVPISSGNSFFRLQRTQ